MPVFFRGKISCIYEPIQVFCGMEVLFGYQGNRDSIWIDCEIKPELEEYSDLRSE
jgi:hypothetical protein